MKKIKIICTIGPSSSSKKILKNLKKEKVDIFRINLSHTQIDKIESKIISLKKNKIKNICIDTEGAQIRTTLCKKKYYLKKNKIIKIFNSGDISNDKIIYLYPEFDICKIKKNSRLDIGFNNLSLVIKKVDKNKNELTCKVTKSGFLESKKGVHLNKEIFLPPLTKKDLFALKLAKKYNIKYFAISFVNQGSDVKEVRKVVGSKAFIISKIETKRALHNLLKIAKTSDALLIDRGDLSRYIPIESIPLAQEQVINFLNRIKKPTYIATNLLETMIRDTLPTRAESHDIYASLKQGAKGLVLAAETAIGQDPVSCVKFLKKCINSYKKKIKIIN
jgi:pyruvate kinase